MAVSGASIGMRAFRCDGLTRRVESVIGRTRGAGALKGTKCGAGVGLGLGVFNIGFSDCSGEHCGAGDKAVGVAAFTAIGAGVGSLLGTVVRAERWERLQLPPRTNPPAVATTLR
jgi:hypothetical protein